MTARIEERICEVVVLGCGLPSRSMGWYHAVQLLDGRCPSAKLVGIVEPFFLGDGFGTDAAQAFHAWQKSVPDVAFCSSVSELPPPKEGLPRMALIASRTADMPSLFRAAIEGGCTFVYLEKPGAPTVTELEAMRNFAREQAVPVSMGYNKNVSTYIRDVLKFRAQTSEAVELVEFIHCNDVPSESLAEAPLWAEGPGLGCVSITLCHEIMLLVTFFGLTADLIDSVTPDLQFSVRETHRGKTDYRRLRFVIATKDGQRLALQADRCGGAYSAATIQANGIEIFRSRSPDDNHKVEMQNLEKARPGLPGYFYQQDPDYVILKERCAKHALDGLSTCPEGVGTIDGACEVMRVIEKISPIIDQAISVQPVS